MGKLSKSLLLSMLTVFVMACGGGGQSADAGLDAALDAGIDAGGEDAGGDGSLIPLANYCQSLTEAYCDFLRRCPVPGQAVAPLADCLEGSRGWCADALLVDMEALGWIAYSPAQADACLAEMALLDCQDFDHAGRDLNGQTACGQVLASMQADQSPCVSGFECLSGVCRFSDLCPGTCAPVVGLDADCSGGQVCADGSLCWQGVCMALPGNPGDACPEGFCAWPLLCRMSGTDNSSWRCAELGLTGEVCGPDARVCFPGLFCKQEQSDGPGLCAVPGQEGAVCQDSSECYEPAGPVLLCSGGTCLPAPAAGEPCEEYSCDQAWCDTQAITPTCVALAQQGQNCSQDSRCLPELFCRDELCQPRLQVGENCALHNWGCVRGLICRAERCVSIGGAVCEPEE